MGHLVIRFMVMGVGLVVAACATALPPPPYVCTPGVGVVDGVPAYQIIVCRPVDPDLIKNIPLPSGSPQE